MGRSTAARAPWVREDRVGLKGDKSKAQKLPPFADLHRAYAESVRKLLHRYGSGGDLDDLVQETFIHVWKGYANFRGDSSVSTWIYRIAVNVAKNAQRSKRRKWWLLFEGETEELHAPSSAPNAEDSLTQRTSLSAAMQHLSPKLRDTLILYSLKELEIEEIAAVLGISAGTVKSRLHQARTQLAALLSQDEEVS